MPDRKAIVERAARDEGYLSGKGFNQRNKFSSYLGYPGEAWCADFVTAIYAMCGLQLPSMQAGHRTGFSYVPDGWRHAKQHGATRNSWQAQPGDIVCFDWTGSGACQSSQTHTGIVDHWAAGTLNTIEGNSSPGGGVNRHKWQAPRDVGHFQICGVIDTGKLVEFGPGGGQPPPEHHEAVPPFPGRVLMLKTPLMEGNDVEQWQRQMEHRGWRLPTSGTYDERTRDVCVKFQEQKDLPANGRVATQTWAAAWTAPVTPE